LRAFRPLLEQVFISLSWGSFPELSGGLSASSERFSEPFREVSEPFREVSESSREVSEPFREVSESSREVSESFREVSESSREVSVSSGEPSRQKAAKISSTNFHKGAEYEGLYSPH
jgi:methyl-accepting chemotaxis protein